MYWPCRNKKEQKEGETCFDFFEVNAIEEKKNWERNEMVKAGKRVKAIIACNGDGSGSGGGGGGV